MLQKTAILTFTFLLACAYAQNDTYYDEPGSYQNEPETHIVKRGETLYAISKKYGVSVKEIMLTNQLRNSTIKIGQRLAIESYSSNRRMTNRSQDNNPAMKSGGLKVQGPRTYYKVQRGDNIYAIASQFGVLVDEIREWNGISNISVGQTLIVGKNDIARIPAYRPAAPDEYTREDEGIYRRLSSRTSSRSLNQQSQRRASNTYDRNESSASISSYRKSSQYNDYDARYAERNADRYNDRYDNQEVVDYSRNSTDSYRRNNADRFMNSSDRYAEVDQVDDSRFFSSDNSRRMQSSYNDFRDENTSSRMPRAADINAGSRAGVLYEYVGDDVSDNNFSSNRYETLNSNESRMNARTLNPRESVSNARTANPSNLTGDFTELKSKKATNNRFYAFHNSLPIGSKVKMRIPKNEGFVEVEIIDRLPSYERVMIGLSPACTAILEGAGNPHTVTITAE